MTIRLLSALLFLALSIGVIVSPTVAKSQDTSPQQRLCEVFENLYDGANKQLGAIFVEGFSDDSAPRETNRQIRMLNQRLFQLILIFQMQAYECDVPKHPSDGMGYYVDAMECSTERIKGNLEHPECDRSEWTDTRDNLDHFR